MNYPNPETYRQTQTPYQMLTNLVSAELAALSKWIDEAPANAARNPEAATWGRVSKVAEESGEVADELLLLAVRKLGLDSAAGRIISAMIAWTGQNPRKEQDDSAQDRVIKELADVMVTAGAAIEHLTGNHGEAYGIFVRHLHGVTKRAGL
jgi:hypothetical protein